MPRKKDFVKRANLLQQEIVAYGAAVLVAMTMVYVIVDVGVVLTGAQISARWSAAIASVLCGLGTCYAMVTNKKLRESITEWINDRV